MNSDDPAEEPNAGDVGAWQRLSAGGHLNQGPTPVGPGHVPAGGDLNLEIGWDRFEKLLVQVARDVLGLADVRFRRYGTEGQKQHGIDLAGRHPQGSYTVVQCKEYDTFAPADLRKAVENFGNGRRPFEAKHFVVAVSQSTRRTQLEEELADLQHENKDLELELWGSEQINDTLRNRADIVGRFWTRETADTFCTGAPLPGVAAADPDWIRLTERVLLTPLGVEGVEARLHDADRAFAQDPTAAAADYAVLADLVDEQGFRGHAHVLRRKQLDALERANRLDAFAALSADLAATALHEGDLDTARSLAYRLEGVARRLTQKRDGDTPHGEATEAFSSETIESVRAHTELISTAIHMAEHPLGEKSALEAALQSLPDFEADYRPLLVLLLAELTMASALVEPTNQPIVDPGGSTLMSSQDLATAAVEGQETLIQTAIAQICGAASTPTTTEVLVRLQLIRACYDQNERRDLVHRARTLKMPRRHAAIILASQARRDALAGAAAEALEGYRAAVRCAIEDGRTDDARGWLYAIREINVRYGPWTDSLDEEHLLAQALPAGTTRLVIRVRDPERDARVNALNKRANAAISAARRWLADSVALGDTCDEQSAAELLGDLYAANSEVARAAAAYQWAGSTKKVEDLAEAVGDVALPVAPVGVGPYWQQLSSLEVLITQHDLVDDSTATALLPVLTDLVVAGHAGELVDDLSRSLLTRVTKAACTFAGRGTEGDARVLLHVLAADVARQENQYKYHDAEHVRACKSIAAHHEQLVLPALTRVLDLAEVGTHDALQALGEDLVQRLLRGPEKSMDKHQQPLMVVAAAEIGDEDRSRLRARLATMAGAGRYQAGIAMSALGGLESGGKTRAEQARDRLLSRPEPDGMTFSFGTTMVPDSFQVSFLDIADQQAVLNKLMSIAGDAREAAQNRQDALSAACNLVIDVPEDVKRQVHEQSRSFAAGENDGSFLDAETSDPHPLSMARINFGPVSLRPQGLRLALWSAVSFEEKHWVKEEAKAMLAQGEPTAVHQAAALLSRLGGELLSDLDARLLANHPVPVVQQLAVVVAAAAPLQNESLLTALAVDSDASVRRLVAHRLIEKRDQLDVGPTLDTISGILTRLTADPRHSVRRAAAGLAS